MAIPGQSQSKSTGSPNSFLLYSSDQIGSKRWLAQDSIQELTPPRVKIEPDLEENEIKVQHEPTAPLVRVKVEPDDFDNPSFFNGENHPLIDVPRSRKATTFVDVSVKSEPLEEPTQSAFSTYRFPETPSQMRIFSQVEDTNEGRKMENIAGN